MNFMDSTDNQLNSPAGIRTPVAGSKGLIFIYFGSRKYLKM